MVPKYGQTDIHPVALLLTLAMGVAMLMVRRDRAVVPLLIVACLVTHAQRIVVGGLDFSMLRLVILFGWARLLFRGETSSYRWHPLDGAMIAWQLLATVAYMLGPRASTAAFVFRLGTSLDALGIYFLFRILLRDVVDIRRTVGAFSWIAIAMVLPMLVEHATGRNIFSLLGGVPEITRIREGRLRCQASFSHPIMAGNFGATTTALVLVLFLIEPAQRVRHAIAVFAASAVTILSASSGPLMAWLACFVGWALWPQRRNMRAIRWGTFLVLLFLHLVREKPVWHLLARLASITGGTGYHRFKLIDEFIAHFGEWWLIGTGSTEHWNLAQASDITNQYILEGIRGGLPTLIAFITVLVLGFRTAGRSVRAAQRMPQLSPAARQGNAMLGWGLGVCLSVHAVAFIGVSYFGQLSSILYLHLAMIPSFAIALARVPAPAAAPAPQPSPVRERSSVPPPGPAPVAGTLTRRVR
jgi:hypothetical protein